MRLSTIRNGNRGTDVKILQISLNASLSPSPKLGVDGVFGQNTHKAVLQFQQECQLATDGIVGAKTWAALQAPRLGKQPSQELKSFQTYLGTESDFVILVAGLEAKHKSIGEVFEKLREHFKNPSVKRFMLVTGDSVGVIDFQHFFGAAWESYNSGLSKSAYGVGIGGSTGITMLLGLGNELSQCAHPSQWHSCFGKEDLGSNRLGARFGAEVKLQESQQVSFMLSRALQQYVSGLRPLHPNLASKIRMQSNWKVAKESLIAIATGAIDVLSTLIESKAY